MDNPSNPNHPRNSPNKPNSPRKFPLESARDDDDDDERDRDTDTDPAGGSQALSDSVTRHRKGATEAEKESKHSPNSPNNSSDSLTDPSSRSINSPITTSPAPQPASVKKLNSHHDSSFDKHVEAYNVLKQNLQIQHNKSIQRLYEHKEEYINEFQASILKLSAELDAITQQKT